MRTVVDAAEGDIEGENLVALDVAAEVADAAAVVVVVVVTAHVVTQPQ